MRIEKKKKKKKKKNEKRDIESPQIRCTYTIYVYSQASSLQEAVGQWSTAGAALAVHEVCDS